MDYIFDTSAVILLYEKCNLRKQLCEFSKTNKLYIPSRALAEFRKGKDVKSIDPVEFKKVFSVVNPESNSELLPYFNFKDCSGEFSVLTYALKNRECCCVIDEDFGRNIATLFEMQLTGAMGILDAMREHDILTDSELPKIREKIKKSGFYLSKKLLRELDKICSPNQTTSKTDTRN